MWANTVESSLQISTLPALVAPFMHPYIKFEHAPAGRADASNRKEADAIISDFLFIRQHVISLVNLLKEQLTEEPIPLKRFSQSQKRKPVQKVMLKF